MVNLIAGKLMRNSNGNGFNDDDDNNDDNDSYNDNDDDDNDNDEILSCANFDIQSFKMDFLMYIQKNAFKIVCFQHIKAYRLWKLTFCALQMSMEQKK